MRWYNTDAPKRSAKPFLLDEKYYIKTKKIHRVSKSESKLRSPRRTRRKCKRKKIIIIEKRIVQRCPHTSIRPIVSHGAQGLSGDRGFQGVPGHRGIQGPQGPQGLQGLPGLQGLQGLPGPQGLQGLPGPQGLQGLPGLQGLQGLPGPQGLQGVPGLQGLQGLPGLQGLQGLPGPQGLQGLPGPQGQPGPTGPIPDIHSILTVKRYFYIASSDISLPTDISANQFTNDDDQEVVEFTDLDQISYINLYINGIMQAGGTYSVIPSTLSILYSQNPIFSGTPIVLETVQFSIKIIT